MFSYIDVEDVPYNKYNLVSADFIYYIELKQAFWEYCMAIHSPLPAE